MIKASTEITYRLVVLVTWPPGPEIHRLLPPLPVPPQCSERPVHLSWGRTGRTAGSSPSFFESMDRLGEIELGPDAP